MASSRKQKSTSTAAKAGGKKSADAEPGKKSGTKAANDTNPIGHGGETHQVATGSTPTLTTRTGTPIADDQNSLKVGERGPTLLEDFVMREKIFHFDHERIPERVVHARDSAPRDTSRTTSLRPG